MNRTIPYTREVCPMRLLNEEFATRSPLSALKDRRSFRRSRLRAYSASSILAETGAVFDSESSAIRNEIPDVRLNPRHL
jgi:hypothetical protein